MYNICFTLVTPKKCHHAPFETVKHNIMLWYMGVVFSRVIDEWLVIKLLIINKVSSALLLPELFQLSALYEGYFDEVKEKIYSATIRHNYKRTKTSKWSKMYHAVHVAFHEVVQSNSEKDYQKCLERDVQLDIRSYLKESWWIDKNVKKVSFFCFITKRDGHSHMHLCNYTPETANPSIIQNENRNFRKQWVFHETKFLF